MITITLQQIEAHNPCTDGWAKVLRANGGVSADRTQPFALASVLDSNDLSDTLWCLQCLPEYDAVWRLYAVWCARQVQHLMVDQRSIRALDVATDYALGKATSTELAAAADKAYTYPAYATYAARAAAAYAAYTAADAHSADIADAARKKQADMIRRVLNADAPLDEIKAALNV